MFGGQNAYLEDGRWQLVTSYRGFASDKHYQGTKPFPELDPGGPDNRQSQIGFDVRYGLSPRLELAASLPLHFNSFTLNRVPPGGTQRVKDATRARGLGDVSLRGRYWLLGTGDPGRNVSLSLGVKLPTGRHDVTDSIYGATVPVDWSIQLGDNAVGVLTGLDGFLTRGRMTFFGSGQYLFSPRDTTGTPAFFGSLQARPGGVVSPNSATDQYSLQAGAAFRATGWAVPSLAYRLEGVPVKDVLGASNGQRRPGAIQFLEPGLTLRRGKHLVTLSMPIKVHVDIKDSPFSVRVEDATVPDVMFLIAHSIRF